MRTYEHDLTPVLFEQVTVGATAVGITPPAGSLMALIQVKAQPVVWRDDGTAPTGTVGHDAPVGTILEAYGSSAGSIQFIRTGTDSTLNVTYYGNKQ